MTAHSTNPYVRITMRPGMNGGMVVTITPGLDVRGRLNYLLPLEQSGHYWAKLSVRDQRVARALEVEGVARIVFFATGAYLGFVDDRVNYARVALAVKGNLLDPRDGSEPLALEPMVTIEYRTIVPPLGVLEFRVTEALTHGVPTIATEEGGLPVQLVEGPDGFLLSPVPGLDGARSRAVTDRLRELAMLLGARALLLPDRDPDS